MSLLRGNGFPRERPGAGIPTSTFGFCMKNKKEKVTQNLKLWIRKRCGLKGLMHLDHLNQQELSALADLREAEKELNASLAAEFARVQKIILEEMQKQQSIIQDQNEANTNNFVSLKMGHYATKTAVSDLSAQIKTLSEALTQIVEQQAALGKQIQAMSDSLAGFSDKIQSIESRQNLTLLHLVMNHADNLLSQETANTKKKFINRFDQAPRSRTSN